MIDHIAKMSVSAPVNVAVSETSKRSGCWDGASLVHSSLWFVLPSIPFFIIPALNQSGRSFLLSMLVALIATAASDIILAATPNKFGNSL